MLEVKEPGPGLSAASDAPAAAAPRRRRPLLVALGIAGVVLLVAASVAAVTWKPAGGHRTDRVTMAEPAPPIAVQPDSLPPVPTTVVAAEPAAVPPAQGPKAAGPQPTVAPRQSHPAPACTLATGYPLTIPEAMTTGPDGAEWFTQPGVARIGRLTTAGAYSSFPVTDMPGDKNGIAAGADGALWFSQTYRIGRMTTSGDVRSYDLPITGKPGRMVAGPDGAVWFVETNRAAIGRITTKGDVTEVKLPGTQPAGGIVAGPDGALWVARGDIFRVSTAGDVKEYAVAQFSQDNVQPEAASGGIVAAKDGAIWFITQYALHRMTVDGHDMIESGSPSSTSDQSRAHQTDLVADRGGDFWISTIATGGSSGTVQRVSGQSPKDSQPAKGYPGDAPIAVATGPLGAAWIGTSPSTAKGAPYGPSTVLRLTTDGTTVVKALPCPS